MDEGELEVTEYEWDHRNRLVSVTYYATYGTSDWKVSYVYDPFNRLIGRTLDPHGEGGSATPQDTYFVYDGNQIVLQFDTTGSDPATKNDLSHRYLWVPGVDQILADEQVAAGELYWPLGDHLRTVRDLAVFFEGTPNPGDGLL